MEQAREQDPEGRGNPGHRRRTRLRGPHNATRNLQTCVLCMLLALNHHGYPLDLAQAEFLNHGQRQLQGWRLNTLRVSICC